MTQYLMAIHGPQGSTIEPVTATRRRRDAAAYAFERMVYTFLCGHALTCSRVGWRIYHQARLAYRAEAESLDFSLPYGYHATFKRV